MYVCISSWYRSKQHDLVHYMVVDDRSRDRASESKDATLMSVHCPVLMTTDCSCVWPRCAAAPRARCVATRRRRPAVSATSRRAKTSLRVELRYVEAFHARLRGAGSSCLDVISFTNEASNTSAPDHHLVGLILLKDRPAVAPFTDSLVVTLASSSTEAPAAVS